MIRLYNQLHKYQLKDIQLLYNLYYLKDHYPDNKCPTIRKLLISINGYPFGAKPDNFIDIAAPSQLIKYFASRETILSNDEILKLVRLMG